ncbi:MAG TPA: hypothetical protein PLA62_11020 [Clostridia bacterium]|nr:hypothetical protein [Spirochaetales bacterium]HQH66680.1 hypothetical protein [Clostridia bacterium]HQK34700.1 hypothetical protein [Spirochaetales bacterium]
MLLLYTYVFNSAGTYRLTVSATFDVCDFTGTEVEWEKEMGQYLNTDKGKKSYAYSLSPITITVTD